MVARRKNAGIGIPIPCTTFNQKSIPCTICLHTRSVCKGVKKHTPPTIPQFNAVFATNCYDPHTLPGVA